MNAWVKRYSIEQIYLLVTDYLVLVGTFAVLLRLRFMPEIDIIDISRLHLIPQLVFFSLYAILILCLFQYDDLYKRKLWFSSTWHMIEIFRIVYIAVVAYIILRFMTNKEIKALLFYPNRSVILGWGLFASALLVFHRVVLFGPILRAFSKTRWHRRVVVIGAGPIAREFAANCEPGKSYHTLTVSGFLDDSWPVDTEVLPGIPCLGRPGDLREITKEHRIEGAVITLSDISYEGLIELVEQCVSLFGWVDIHSDKALCLQKNLNVDTYFDTPFVRLGHVGDSRAITLYKRVTDIVGAALGLLLLSPLLLLTALLTKLTSPGPVFYVTDRIGHKGRVFRFYKFRSMSMGADQDEARKEAIAEFIRNPDSISSKIVNESLVTPFGRFIRNWAIDELPQLFNVLKGDMSLIGPRPSPVAEYRVNDEWHKRRFDIKPGCTGLWKLHTRNEVRFSDTVLYDIYYARNMGPLLDLYIILGTLRVILSGRADG